MLCTIHIQLTQFEVLQLILAEVSLKGLMKVPCFESTGDRANTVLKTNGLLCIYFFSRPLEIFGYRLIIFNLQIIYFFLKIIWNISLPDRSWSDGILSCIILFQFVWGKSIWSENNQLVIDKILITEIDFYWSKRIVD